MLQDLWIPPQSVVPGDFVVHEGRFYKVLISEYGRDTDYKSWRLMLESEGIEKSTTVLTLPIVHHSLTANSPLEPPARIRVRPCGPSSHLEDP
jgi:hypothetical protein